MYFVMEMVDKLLKISISLSYSSTRYVYKKTAEINERKPIHKRRIMVNQKHPTYFPW